MPDIKDSEKLDAIMSGLDSIKAAQKADREKLDAACAKMDSWEKEKMDAAKRDAEEEEKKKSDAARRDAEEEEKKKADAARADAEAEEKKKADAALADAAKRDAEEEERKKADAARADAMRLDSAAITARVDAAVAAAMKARVVEVPPDVRARLSTYQSRWERVYQAFRDASGAPAPNVGETEIDYRARLASKYQSLAKNPKIKDAKLTEIKDSMTMDLVEDAIFNDALAEATHPTTITPGVLLPHKIRDAAGREITKYTGDPNACWDQFNPPIQYVRKILTPGSARLQ